MTEPAGAGVTGAVAGAEVVGIGVDLCEVARMRSTLIRTPGFGERVFTEAERTYCDRRRDPAERYAARFAAKEAVLKAMGLGIGACRLSDIEVVRAGTGVPSIVLHGTALGLAAERGIVTWHVSLTHTSTMAQAMVVATRRPST